MHDGSMKILWGWKGEGRRTVKERELQGTNGGYWR